MVNQDTDPNALYYLFLVCNQFLSWDIHDNDSAAMLGENKLQIQ